MNKRISAFLAALMLTAGLSVSAYATSNTSNTASNASEASSNTSNAYQGASVEAFEDAVIPAITDSGKTAKYVFFFIGDGMSYNQMHSVQVYHGNNKVTEVAPAKMAFPQFPASGVQYVHDATSFAPDSASSGTSLATGIKTLSGVLAMGIDKVTAPENISSKVIKKGMKVGVVSSVTINHATPAVFYAHNESRNNYYDLAMQMAPSGVTYFGGGTISQNTGKNKDQKDMYEVLAEEGFKIAKTKEEIESLNKDSGKVYAVTPAVQDSGAMPYQIDMKDEDVRLKDFVRKGIDVLDNDNGFFMMVESGKIDWAGHANDAKAVIGDVEQLDDAIKVALEFAQKHPEETLIVVTGDHETGGMSIGQASTEYDTNFALLANQKNSYVEFDKVINEMIEADPALTFEKLMPVITEYYGLTVSPTGTVDKEVNPMEMSAYEVELIKNALAENIKPKDQRTKSEITDLLYGGYEPISMTVTRILNHKAGVGWTSYSHTGIPVGVYAIGAKSTLFNGVYDNTEIFHKFVEATGVN